MRDLGWVGRGLGHPVAVGAPNREVGFGPRRGHRVRVCDAHDRPPGRNATPTAELTASDGQTGDELGWSVAISGNTIVAGARARQIEGHDGQGAAYVWTEPSGGRVSTSADTAELTASDGSTDDSLGESVAVLGTTIAAGAPRHYASLSTANYGAAYDSSPESLPAVEAGLLTVEAGLQEAGRRPDRRLPSDVHPSAGAAAGGYGQCGNGRPALCWCVFLAALRSFRSRRCPRFRSGR